MQTMYNIQNTPINNFLWEYVYTKSNKLLQMLQYEAFILEGQHMWSY